ncbi:DEAD/DEAH box helicase [Saccharopolyspora spinosporotrichia]
MPGMLQATFVPGCPDSSAVGLAFWGTGDPAAAAAALGLRSGRPTTLRTVLPTADASPVVPADVPAVAIALDAVLPALAAMPACSLLPRGRRPGDSVFAWSTAAKLALELVTAGMVVPTARVGEEGAVARWRLVSAHDGRLAALARAMPAAAHALRRDDAHVWTAAEALGAFCDAVADTCARGSAVVDEPVSWEQRWIAALSGTSPALDAPDERLRDELDAWARPLLPRTGAAGRLGGRLCLRLRAPRTGEAPWELEFHLRAAAGPATSVPAERAWSAGNATLELPGCSIGEPQDSLVRGLAEAARLFPPIDRALSEPRPTGIRLDVEQAAAFLADGEPALTAAGISVEVPDDLGAGAVEPLRARLRATAEDAPGSAAVDGREAATFRWEAVVGDTVLTRDEVSELVAPGRPLVRWRGRWVRVDARRAARIAALMDTAVTLSSTEALAAALEGSRTTAELGEVDVRSAGRLRALVDRLGADGHRQPRLAGIDATLRRYQERGAAWLQMMAELGLGAVLADDMGLGKTLQTIALLADRPGHRPHLVVCPTSVVDNWEREIRRFAPGLRVVRHHGTGRAATAEAFPPGAVVVTTYTLLRLDSPLLSEVDWDVVVLDEAQQIKNHTGQTAQAAARLRAAARVALTGTPVENRLAELWSIMHFANPGLLGRFPRFRDRFAVAIERWRDPDATRRLRSVVAPFLLRRLKSEVATDLPAKVESVVSCALTDEQAELYRATVRGMLDEQGMGEGIARRGRILKLLTALKQICNHPAHFLRQPGPLHGRSGKLERTAEMLSEVVAAGDRALVFTQYRVMGELLAGHLAAELELPAVPFLHGGVSAARRSRMVEEFQHSDDAAPVLVVSLKAGGTGLNLTRATHVVHYDRWWNPAVEDQATDRAHRIGQTRGVHVHKLVTHGTLEERIADLLDCKRGLADAVVGSGETWLTELSDDALRALVALGEEEA